MAVFVGIVEPFPGLDPDKAQALKPIEEAAEVFGAWQEWERSRLMSMPAYEEERRMAALYEVADCIQACADLAYAMGCDDLAPYMAACEERNRKRGRYDCDER